MKVLFYILGAVFSVFMHIYVTQQAWNLFMPHYGFAMLEFKQAWIYGVVLSYMSGAGRIMTCIKSEAKEDKRKAIAYRMRIPFLRAFDDTRDSLARILVD